MAELKLNPNYNEALRATATNQKYVFADPNQIINPVTNQTAESLTPATPLIVPPPTHTPDLASDVMAGAEATSKTIQDYIKEQTPPETELSKQIQSLLRETTAALPGLEGRGAEQGLAEQRTGVPKYSQELAGLNAQILQGLAEQKATEARYEKMKQQEEGRAGVTMRSVIGEQSQIYKMQLAERNAKSADLGLLQARALGLQGQLEAAQKAADRAVELKFADRQSIIDTKLKQLELYYPEFDKEQKRYADALANKLKDEQTKIDEQKAIIKANITMGINNNVATQFYNYGGEIRQTSTGKAYSTEAEFIKDTGMNVAQATAKGIITDIGQTGQVQDMAKQYPDAGILPTDSLQVATAKLKNSRIYQDKVREPVGSGISTSVIEVGGKKILINSKTGETIKELGASDGTPLPPAKLVELQGAGFSQSDITNITNDINQYGITKVLEGITDPNQKKTLQKIYGVEVVQTKEEIEADMKMLFTDDELQKIAKELGYASMLHGQDWEIENMFNNASVEELKRAITTNAK